MYSKFVYGVASSILITLTVASVAFAVLALPDLAYSLSTHFGEHSGTGWIVQILLTTPTLLFAAFLLEVQLLLREIHWNQMFLARAQTLVKLMSATSFAIALALFAILAWFASWNVVPAIIGIVLVGSIVIALGSSFGMLVLLRFQAKEASNRKASTTSF